jgi:DNA repair exonuclease SbcCD ATPase subunit
MTTTSNIDLQQLKEFIGDRFNQLERKIDTVKSELKQEITEVKSELKQEITEVKSELKQEITEVKSELKQEITEVKSEFKQEIADLRGDIKTIDARIKNVETAVQKIPDLSEKFGELKNWRQIVFIIIAAVVGWFAKSGRI